jgi:hypothetical protein
MAKQDLPAYVPKYIGTAKMEAILAAIAVSPAQFNPAFLEVPNADTIQDKDTERMKNTCQQQEVLLESQREVIETQQREIESLR